MLNNHLVHLKLKEIRKLVILGNIFLINGQKMIIKKLKMRSTDILLKTLEESNLEERLNKKI